MSMVSYIQRILKEYAENMKKIMEAVWELRAKKHSQSSPFPPKLSLTGRAILQGSIYFQHI
jgi:hypothetical protein